MASFKARLDRRARNLEVNTNDAIKRLSVTVAQSVVFRTPVDTGHARANWQVEIGSSPTTEIPTTDKGGGATFSKAVAEINRRRSGDTLYIVNNVPYINRLNDGYSAQAPAAFIETSIQTAIAAFENPNFLGG